MLRIAVCDDDMRWTNEIENLLINICKSQNIKCEIEIFFSGAGLEKAVLQENKYDLIYLDIEMQGANGIQTAQQIRKKDENVLIIYVSSHESYFRELFEVNPFWFQDKPIKTLEFTQNFKDAYHKITQEQFNFSWTFNKQIFRLPIKDILYFESEARTIIIHEKSGKIHRLYGKMNMIEERVSETKHTFWRIHQSYLVNHTHIKKITFSKIELINGEILNISTEKQKMVREHLYQQVRGEMFGGSYTNI